MHLKNKLLFLLFWQITILISAQNATPYHEGISLITSEKEFVAGSAITLTFKTSKNTNYKLYCSNSYGTTVVSGKTKNNNLSYHLPKHLSKKRGIVHWELIGSKKPLIGRFIVNPKQIPVALETYIGPPSIISGGKSFTMHVVIPTDDLDNPLKKDTKIIVQHQFLSSEIKSPIYTNNLIAYKNIYSPLKSGRMLLSSESLGLNSKEQSVNIMPSTGTNFKIFSNQHHNYADGNQITTFSTSIIKDKNNNIISDGNFVDFFITTKNGNILKTNGTTINGVAYAKIIHPDHEDRWKIKAYITGIAESTTLEMSYKKVINDFTVTFSKKNRQIQVGPLQSFMSQMIPDGLLVKLTINKDEKTLNEMIESSIDGYVTFTLDPNIYKNDLYTIQITTAEITKTFYYKKLW